MSGKRFPSSTSRKTAPPRETRRVPSTTGTLTQRRQDTAGKEIDLSTKTKGAAPDIKELIAKSSIGAALADIKARGIDAHLVDLERELNPRRTTKKPPAKKLSAEDTAFMRGFGTALASIWRCQHEGQMVRQLIKQNGFTLASFRGIGMLDTDLAAIRKAVRS